jgi:hypothetical protein
MPRCPAHTYQHYALLIRGAAESLGSARLTPATREQHRNAGLYPASIAASKTQPSLSLSLSGYICHEEARLPSGNLRADRGRNLQCALQCDRTLVPTVQVVGRMTPCYLLMTLPLPLHLQAPLTPRKLSLLRC